MIRKMQRKFIMIAMLSLALVMFALLIGINAVNYSQVNSRADSILTILEKNDGKFPQSMRERNRPTDKDKFEIEKELFPEIPNGNRPKNPPPDGPKDERGLNNSATNGKSEKKEGRKPPEKVFGVFSNFFGDADLFGPETSFETRYFTVKTDVDGNISETDISSVAALDESEAEEYAKSVLKKKSKIGYKGYYRYLVSEKDYGRLMIFVDRSNQLDMVVKVFGGSVAVALICLLVVFMLVFFLSRRAIKPMIENMEKQKQFITDAGHEIKTPLTIISANNDVLEMTYGENEWSRSIKNQVKRLSELVNNLLMLSKLDEEKNIFYFELCSMNELLGDTLNDFSAVIQSKDINLIKDIKEQVDIYADKGSMRNLLSVLMDNAVKYTNEGGKIEVKLTKHGENVRVEMFNTCENYKELDTDKLFNRFYRADKSRSRESGGYGIGLSVAEALVKAHNGKLSAKIRDNGIVFAAEFKNN